MTAPRVSVVPVGKTDPAEIEAALVRVAKALGGPVELRETVPLPKATENVERGQHDARQLLVHLRGKLPTLRAVKVIGGTAPTAAGAPVTLAQPDAAVFVTDVDLFAPQTEAVLADAAAPLKSALVSVRRLRESFYRRKADPQLQRARLAKEILRGIGRARGLPECNDPSCALSPTQTLHDVDRKAERLCASCLRRLTTGVVRV
ncbi:MAG TPA: archaemetzincin [Candidatus Polarisedimenticolaceae bacterium]|nr:archaemetzincin [Candidatus Polarisedimenticolaceae bacterium]